MFPPLLLPPKLLLRQPKVFSILFSLPVLLRKGSKRVSWWAPGSQSRLTYHSSFWHPMWVPNSKETNVIKGHSFSNFKVMLWSPVYNVLCFLHSRFPQLFTLSDLKYTLGPVPDHHPFYKGCSSPALCYSAPCFLWGLYFCLDIWYILGSLALHN